MSRLLLPGAAEAYARESLLLIEPVYNFNSLFKYPSRFLRLRDMEAAIKAWAGASLKIQWRHHQRALQALRWHDEQKWVPWASDWHARSGVQTLQSAYEVTIRILPSLNVNDLSLFSQTALHDLLRAAKEPPLLEHLLRRRWSSRWSANFKDGIPIGTAVRRAHRCVCPFMLRSCRFF